MKKKLLFLVCFFWVWLLQAQNAPPTGYIRVKVTPEVAAALEKKSDKLGQVVTRSSTIPLAIGIKSFDATLSDVNASGMKRLFPYHPVYEERQRKSGLHLWYSMSIDESIPDDIAVQRLTVDKNVTIVEKYIPPVLYSDPLISVNDPDFSKQWNLHNTGQTGGTPGADINMLAGWAKQMSASNVIVAIIDGGVDISHPDLVDNLWVNEAEFNGSRGVDNDGNGYVDDVYGFNFVRGDGNITPHYHGIHVAGLVAASTNNGIGVAGVAGGTGKKDGARIMSCQIYAGTPNKQTSAPDNGPAFVYAANNGAVIAQCSWGWDVPGFSQSYQSVVDGIDYFIEHAGKDKNGNPLPGTPMVGGIVFFASGNSGGFGDYWPGCYDKVWAVGATDHNNQLADYTNFGPWLDILAPGGTSPISVVSDIYSTYLNHKYEWLQGTSMACPQVSGLAALILAKFGSGTYTPDMLRKRLELTSKPIPPLLPVHEGYMGYGMIDAGKALEDDSGEGPEKVELILDLISHDFVDLIFTSPSDPDNGNAYSYEARYSTTAITESNYNKLPVVSKPAKPAGEQDTLRVRGMKSNTSYYIAHRSLDIWGNASEMSIIEIKTLGKAIISVTPADTINLGTIDVTVNAKAKTTFNISNIADESVITYSVKHAVARDPRPTPAKNVAEIRMYEVINPNFPDSHTGSEGLLQNPESKEFIAAASMVVPTDSFTLTHVTTGILTSKQRGILADEPFLISVVRGGKNNPGEGETIYRRYIHKEEYSSNIPDDHLFDLGEQLLFAKNETFWIVFTFPPEYWMPMGVDSGIDVSTGQNLYSEDGGMSWHKLSDAKAANGRDDLFDPTPVFRVFAVSKKGIIHDFVSISPSEGVVPAKKTSTISATIDATDIIDGEYVSKIKIFNDDPDNILSHIPVKYKVTGHLPKYNAPKENIGFGVVFVGDEKSEDIEIQNNGLGDLVISDVQFSDPAFTTSKTSLTIPPRQKDIIRVTYKPTGTPSMVASLRLVTNEKASVKTISLQAAGIDPPKIQLDRENISFTATAGDVQVKEFTIKNTGKYDLTYDMSVDRKNGWADEHTGYIARKGELKWDELDWENSEMLSNSSASTIKDLGKSIFYYSRFYDQITITNRGYILMGNQSKLKVNQQLLSPDYLWGVKDMVNGTLAPIWMDEKDGILGNTGSIKYGQFPDHVVVEYQGANIPNYKLGSLDVQCAIYYDGSIEYRYKNYNYGSETVKDTVTLFTFSLIGIESKFAEEATMDGIIIGDFNNSFMYPGDEFSITIMPGSKFVESCSPISGFLVPGDEATISLSLKGNESLISGSYEDLWEIRTNDPENQKKYITINADITALPVPGTDVKEIDFGQVAYDFGGNDFEGKAIKISNTGGVPYQILDVTIDAPFSIRSQPGDYPINCDVFSSLNYYVAFDPTEAEIKDYSDTITFRTNLTGDKEFIKVALKGKSILRAIPELNPSFFSLDIESGNSIDTAVVVKNIGDANLEFYLKALDKWLLCDGKEETIKYIVAPGETQRIPIQINGTELYDEGWPSMGSVGIYSNSPQNEGYLDFGFEMKIAGEPNLVIPDVLDFGITYNYGGTYDKVLPILNDGTSLIKIENLTLSENFKLEDEYLFQGGGIEVYAKQTFQDAKIIYTPGEVPSDGLITGKAIVTYGGGKTKEVTLTAKLYYPPVANIVDPGMLNKVYSATVLPGDNVIEAVKFDLANTGKSILNYEWKFTGLDKKAFDESKPESPDAISNSYSIAGNKTELTKKGLLGKLKMPSLQSYSVQDTANIASVTPLFHNYNFVDSVQYIYCNKYHYPGKGYPVHPNGTIGIEEDGMHAYNTAVQVVDPADCRFATRFKTGTNGMKITHVANWYRSLYEEDMEIKILVGKEYKDAVEVHSQMITARVRPEMRGRVEINELDKTVEIGPDQHFWLVYRHFSTTIYMTLWSYWDWDENHSLSYTDEFIVHLNDEILHIGFDFDQFYLKGYFMGAYSLYESDMTWASVSPGSLEVDETGELTLKMTPPSQNQHMAARSFGRLDLKSNDPLQEDQSLFVEMIINQKPQMFFGYDVKKDKGVNDSRIALAIPENTRDSILIKVKDVDGDKVTLGAMFKGGNLGEKEPAVSLVKKEEGLYMFPVETYFGSAGRYIYEFTATDANGLTNMSTMNLVVEKVYRNPILIDLPDVQITEGQLHTFNLNDAFMDYDDSPLTYTVSSSNNQVVMPIIIQNSILNVFGVSCDTAIVNVRATNQKGLFVDASFKVKVTLLTSIEGDTQDGIKLRAYPNPAKDYINVAAGLEENGKVEIRIFNEAGALVDRHEYNVQDYKLDERIDISKLSIGIHIIQYSINGKYFNATLFIKQ